MMEGKKRSGQNNRDKPPKEQNVQTDGKRGRKGREKRLRKENKGDGPPSKKPKVGDQGQQVSDVEQKYQQGYQVSEVKGEEDNKVNEPLKELETSVGLGPNINKRHSNQLESFLALMSMKRRPLKITDDRDRVLKFPGCSNGLYMEWDKKDDQYFLWGSTAEGTLQIKFEFHGGFEQSANILDVKKPMLAFSESFDCNNGWREVKKMLQDLFGHEDVEVPTGGYDYMLAFTRTGEMLHFRIFKFHTQPAPDMESIRLEEISPSFILKPLAIYHPGDESTEDVSIEHFMDEEKLMPDRKSDLKLVSCSVLYDDSYQSMVPHTMQPALSHKVMLSLPAKNLEWLGFNTSYHEFFERYYVYRTTLVPGTGPEPTVTANSSDPTASAANSVYYDHITVPMKVFCRNLILFVKEHHRYCCLSDFDEHNIFLRGGQVAILGVKILPYSIEQAKQNFHTVYNIIMDAIHGMTVPKDLQAALNLLAEDPIDSYNIIVNHFAWMIASRRNNMVAELHEDFSELTPDDQVNMARRLPDMDNWLLRFASNRLLFAVQTEMLPAKSVKSLEELQKYFEKKASETQRRAIKENDPTDKLQQNPDAELLLYIGRRYFKGVRNSYVHISGTSIKKKKGPLPIQIVDLVVSSKFADTCSYVQVNVPPAFTNSDVRRSSYERFKAFFSGIEDVDFEDADKK